MIVTWRFRESVEQIVGDLGVGDGGAIKRLSVRTHEYP